MAQVSGIEVRFSGDTSNLEKSVGRAQGAISNFAKGAAASLAAALSVGMFVSAGKAALNYADKIDEMAEKVGIAAEELSALTYAAKVNGVSTEQLQTGLTMLIRSMSEGTEKFDALGVSIYDSNGAMRSANDVLIDVAEKFAGMQDGAAKSAWALELFGRSGLNLIPVLNLGSKGLANATQEAKSFGLVVSGDAAKSAALFNDNLARLGESIKGFVLSGIGPLLPALVDITEALLDLAKNSKVSSTAVDAMRNVLRRIAITAATTYKEFYALAEIAGVLAQNLANPTSISEAGERWKTAFANIKAQAEDTEKTIARLSGAFSASPDDITSMLGSIDGFQQARPRAAPPSLPGSGEAGDTDKGREPDGFYHGEDPFFVERLQMIRDNFATEREILAEEYAMNQEVIRGALDNQLITEQEYHALSEKLAKDHQDTLNQIQSIGLQNNLAMASDFFGSMARIAELGGKKTTKIAKVFGIAQALISTFQGAAKALTLPFPANMAAYASVLAQGMSAVASIRKVNDNGGSNSIGKGSRGGAAASGGDGASGGGRGGGPTTTFSFTLMNDPMGFGERYARQFIDQLNSTQRNGGQIRGVIA
jgi:hypothetical protein